MLIVFSFGALAQKADTLKEVKVHGKKVITHETKINDFSPGQQVLSIESNTLKLYNSQSVANLLAQQTPVFIKAYSFNGLATMNFRGSSAAQSQVLWNGVPIQNAALGMADISTLPVMFLSKVSLVYGGSAAMWGSGNVGGALLIENEAPTFDSGKKALSISVGAGSFNQYQAGLEGSLSGKKWYCSVKALGQTAINNFSYTDEQGQVQKITNSQLKSGSMMVNAALKTGTYSMLTLSGWYQQYDRQIPPALFEASSLKKQQDNSFRVLLGWDQKRPMTTWYAKTSFIKDDINYNDAAILVNSSSSSYQYFAEAGLRRNFEKIGQMILFAPAQLAWINAPTGNGLKYQNRIALAGAYDIKIFHQKLDLAVNGRYEVVNNNSFLLGGFNTAYELNHVLSLRGNIQRTFRLPTLNELYYFPGGNTALKPEYGWSEDAGYSLKCSSEKFNLRHDLAFFNRDIHDWIIWLGGAIWTPHNIAEVHSRGIETENKLEYDLGAWKLHLGVNTSYVLATTVHNYIANDGSIGKQIPYTPMYNGQMNIGFTRKRLFVNYNHTYTGYRFTVVDESQYQQPYQTGNLQVMYTASIGKHQIQLTAQCNNIWNERYAVVAYRPLPGINWLAGVKLNVL